MLLLAASSNAALVTFLIYTIAVFGLAWFSNRLLQSKSFLSEYFLGSRSLGVWAFALTFAATSASGGSFTGFPSKIYSHGWVLGLWIGSYMVVPICAMGLLGKRINNVARISGAITVPDILRDRFRSPSFGLLSVTLIVFFMSFNLVAQFKSGSVILNILLEDVTLFQNISAALHDWTGIDNMQYLVCLAAFGLAVVVYTTYGGFHAVVWTDVMQGVVMVVGVVIMLPLAIIQVGGLGKATRQMVDMVPPIPARATLTLDSPAGEDGLTIKAGSWSHASTAGQQRRVFKIIHGASIEPGETQVTDVSVLEIVTPADIQRIESWEDATWLGNSISWTLPATGRLSVAVDDSPGSLQIAAGTYVRKTTVRGERLYQITEAATLSSEQTESEVTAIELVGDTVLEEDEARVWLPKSAAFTFLPPGKYAYGAEQGRKGVYVTAPGPSAKAIDGFLPLSLAISFFFMWAISGAGQPSSMVRLMAFNSTRTLRRSIFTVSIYYSMIYFPLVVIFCISRVLMPGMDQESDKIMPAMAVHLTSEIKMGWLAGLLVAAPFAAVMSTVDSFLLMISSAVVRDIYQRNINPQAKESTLKKLSYLITILVGTIAIVGAINPPKFLQDIIVYVGSGLAACFLAPMVYNLYWPRSNLAGCLGAMLSGFGAHLAMYLGGIIVNNSFFQPYRLFNMNPIIVGLVVSFAVGWLITIITPPPPEDLVRKYFYQEKG